MALPDPVALRARFDAAGQGHVFAFWDRLTPAQQVALAVECATVPDDALALPARPERADASRGAPASAPAPAPAPAPASASAPGAEAPPQPPPVVPVPASEADRAAVAEARAKGEATLALGQVAIVMLAGGDGSRLGHPGPKGTYPIGPATGKSLYQWFAEQVVARSRRAGRAIPLVVLTSPTTHDATVAFFAANGLFGLAAEQLAFVRQGVRPVRDADGRLLLRAPGALLRAPDGHGGLLAALARAGSLEAWAEAGVRHVFVFQVDNPLVAVCDPETIGRHVAAGADATSRCIEKERPEEPHGVFALRAGRLGVLEYSEIDPALAAARDADGRLTFRAANIAVHVFGLDFLRGAAAATDALPWHAARKRVRVVGPDGTPEAVETTGTKQERFLFDVLARAKRTLLLDGRRARWFAPVKTAEGEFSGPAARDALSRWHARWCEAAGLGGVCDPGGTPRGPVEVSPLLALDADELRRRFVSRPPPDPLRFPLALEP